MLGIYGKSAAHTDFFALWSCQTLQQKFKRLQFQILNQPLNGFFSLIILFNIILVVRLTLFKKIGTNYKLITGHEMIPKYSLVNRF